MTVTVERPLECTGITDLHGDSYVIQLDTSLSLCMAWNPDSPDLSFHNGNILQFTQMFDSTGLTCTVVEAANHNLQYYIHGIFMWMTWALIGLLQICTNRYWRHKWRWNKIVHAVLGFFAAALIITAGFIAIKIGGWTINSQSSLHAKLGFSIFILGLSLMLGGIIGNIIRLKVEMPWKTKKALLVGKVHKWYGRFIIIVSQFVIGTGAYNFYNYDGEPGVGYGIGGGSAAVFFILLIVGEIMFQIKLRKEVPFVLPGATMSAQEFQ